MENTLLPRNPPKPGETRRNPAKPGETLFYSVQLQNENGYEAAPTPLTTGRVCARLTDVSVPLVVEVGVVGEAALHHVHTEVVTRLQLRHALAVRAVGGAHEGATALRRRGQL